MTTPTLAAGLRRALLLLHRMEDLLLALLLGAMILVAAAQILLRNLFEWNFGWGDPFTRLLVLWVGLLGALAATRQNRHIAIDLVTHLLPPRVRAGAQALNNLFAGAVCGVVAWYAVIFIREERGLGGAGLLGLPDWLLHAVIPLGFTLIALRYLLHALLRAWAAAIGEAGERT
jgi:TRAP-type C4-dicarboxylate transport system permease small subunit